MDSHERNKIVGAVLGTILFVLVLRVISGALFETQAPAKPGYIVPGVVEETTASTTAAPAAEVMPDWGTVLPAADTSKGQDISHKCEQCHNLNKGGAIKIGPPLYNVVGRARATYPGFDYSAAIKAMGGNWTFDELFKFLKSPQAYIQGTKMGFSGLPSAEDRINIIAYLRTNSDSPVPIPPPSGKSSAPSPAAGGSAPAAPAGATTAPAGSSAPATAAPAATPQGGPTTPATPPKKS
jgi:cytochrome c